MDTLLPKNTHEPNASNKEMVSIVSLGDAESSDLTSGSVFTLRLEESIEPTKAWSFSGEILEAEILIDPEAIKVLLLLLVDGLVVSSELGQSAIVLGLNQINLQFSRFMNTGYRDTADLEKKFEALAGLFIPSDVNLLLVTLSLHESEISLAGTEEHGRLRHIYVTQL